MENKTTGGPGEVPYRRRQRLRGGAQQRRAHEPDHGLPALGLVQRLVREKKGGGVSEGGNGRGKGGAAAVLV